MRRIQKRAYLATTIILLLLAGLAYYTYLQTQELEVGLDGKIQVYQPQDDKTELEAPTNNTQSPSTTTTTPTTENSPEPAPPIPLPKSKSFIVELDQYKAKPTSITAPVGYKINLILKAGQDLSGQGLRVQMPDQFPVLIKPGQSETLSFIAEQSLTIDVYLEGTQTKAPYVLPITVK